MENSRFDDVARLFAESGSRRALLHLLATLPAALAFVSLTDQEALSGRRRRRKARHRRHHRGHHKRCRAQSKAQLCAGKCGTVKDRCKKKVDCGPCQCDPPCPACQTCNTKSGTCGPDAEQLGNACGEENRACHEDGSCQACEVCASGCAFSSLQAAIDAADSGATITICPGTYSGGSSIGNDVTLAGAGDGADAASNTILDGEEQNTVITVSQGPTVTLRGMRIINGDAISGGGIANQGTLTVVGCTLTANGADQGGAAYNNGGALTFTQSSITVNFANNEGGGIHNDSGTLVLNDSQISGNHGGNFGGGILNNCARTTLNGATVSGNTAGSGGGIYNEIGTVTLQSGSSVTNNNPDNCAGEAISGCSG